MPSALARRIGLVPQIAWLRVDQVDSDTAGQTLIYSQHDYRGDCITVRIARLRRWGP